MKISTVEVVLKIIIDLTNVTLQKGISNVDILSKIFRNFWKQPIFRVTIATHGIDMLLLSLHTFSTVTHIN